jgi:hypothetical protein
VPSALHLACAATIAAGDPRRPLSSSGIGSAIDRISPSSTRRWSAEAWNKGIGLRLTRGALDHDVRIHQRRVDPGQVVRHPARLPQQLGLGRDSS